MRKWTVVAVVLSLSGCASPGGGAPHQQWRQAAPAYAPMPARMPGPVRMGNTYRPVGTTLYGVGEAAPHEEQVPRSPNKRVLPSTKEPGLWAADGAPSAGLPAGPVRLLDCTLPVPMKDGKLMNSFGLFCMAYISNIFEDLGLVPAFYEIKSVAQRECLVAKTYRMCAETLRFTQPEAEAQAPIKEENNEAADDWRKWSGETAKLANAYKRDKCSPENDTLAVRKFYSLVHREWIRRQPGAVVPND